MCCSDTQGWLGFPWPLCLKRGWAKTCATLPWPIRGWSLQVVFAVLTRRSPIGASGCQGCAAPSGARPGLDAGASGDYLAWPSKGGKPQRPEAGQGSGSRAAPTREASLAMGSLPPCSDLRHIARPVKDRSAHPGSAATHEGRGGTLPPQDPPATASASSSTRVRRLSPARTGPATVVRQHRGPPDTPFLPALAARQRWPSCWCAPRGQALTQEPGGITFQMLARREERPQRTSGRSGPAAEPAGAYAIRRAPVRGMGVTGTSGTGRAQRRWCLPLAPGGRIGEARRSGRSCALPSRRGAGTSPGSPAVAGAVQRRRRFSRCTDRPAGGCADKCTFSATRA